MHRVTLCKPPGRGMAASHPYHHVPEACWKALSGLYTLSCSTGAASLLYGIPCRRLWIWEYLVFSSIAHSDHERMESTITAQD